MLLLHFYSFENFNFNLLFLLFFLCYRRTRCNPKENFHKMGQQTFEKGNSRFFFFCFISSHVLLFIFIIFCELLCVLVTVSVMSIFKLLLLLSFFLNELNENFLAVALNERNGKEKFTFFSDLPQIYFNRAR